MKILIINYRFFISGGPERYMFNLIDLLEKNEHEVIPFSINYAKNKKTRYHQYFVSPISTNDAIYFKDHTKNVKSIYKALVRTFWSLEVYKKLSLLIKQVEPDVAIVLHYQKKLSPSIISCLNRKKIPFVVRLSDFGLICPNAHLLRNKMICEECIEGGLWQSVKYSCVQNSKLISFLNFLSLKFQKFTNNFDNIPMFIVPSIFTIEKYITAGWKRDKFFHNSTFISEVLNENYHNRKQLILYVGRVDYTKGLDLLLEAVNFLNKKKIAFEIKIIGNGEEEYMNKLVNYSFKFNLKNVKFTGYLEKESILHEMRMAKATIVPSIWYDNQPNSALESLSQGTPIIVSNHGSLAELVLNGKNGFLFEPNNVESLALCIEKILKHKNHGYLSNNSIEFITKNHSKEIHYNILMNILNNLKNK